MRTITIFYAWQSDTPQRFNRHLIRIALEAAADRINQDTALEVEVCIDADTEGVPGQPPITETIQVRSLTATSSSPTSLLLPKLMQESSSPIPT